MKRSESKFLLLILPVILFGISVFCKISVGDYYLGGYYDPAYAYLMNSLNLSQLSGYGVGHFDHPGTTVQTAGAIVVKLFYMLGKTDNDIAKDVISRPEFYLSRISFFFMIITGASLYLLGLSAFSRFGSIKTAMIIQLTPLFPPTVYDHLADVSSESLFIPAIILLLAAVIRYTNLNGADPKIQFRSSFILGMCCGFGLAGKIIFLPLIIIPFILIRQLKYKIFFLLFTILFFLIFVYPALSIENAAKYLNWISGIATHSGKYGSGKESVIDTSTYFVNLKNIFLTDLSFVITYSVLFFTTVAGIILKIKNRYKKNYYFLLSAVIFFVMTIQIFLVAKHFDARYMITVNMLSVTALTAVCFAAGDYITPALSKKISVLFTVIVVLFSSYRLVAIYTDYSEYAHNRDETEELNSFVNRNYNKLPLIYSNLINNQVYSLYFGTDWAGSQQKRYISVIQDLHPDNFYFDRYADNFILTDMDLLKSSIKTSDTIIFQSDTNDLIERFMIRLKELTGNDRLNYNEVYSNDNGEKLYEIKIRQ